MLRPCLRLLSGMLAMLVMLVMLVWPPREGAAAAAPPAQPTGSLLVRVLATDSTIIEEAEVSAGRDEAHRVVARSDAFGEARLSDLPVGMLWLSVRRLGLAPQRTLVRIGPGQNRYTVRLESASLSLVGVRVVGNVAYTARLDDFERRRIAGTASAVVTREQIDRLGPLALSRLLRGMAGLRIGDSLGNVVAISTRGAKPTLTAGRNQFALVQCVMRVAVDGVLLPPFTNLDQIVPRDVHGIEVYFGPARLPPELAGVRTDNWCGVVAVWTRGG